MQVNSELVSTGASIYVDGQLLGSIGPGDSVSVSLEVPSCLVRVECGVYSREPILGQGGALQVSWGLNPSEMIVSHAKKWEGPFMRRANGTGSTVKLSGNRRRLYLVKISARDKDGYVRQVAPSYHARLQEAQDALEEYNRKAAAGQIPSADMLSWIVEQVYVAWLERGYPRSGKSSVAFHKAFWDQRVFRYAARKMRSVTLGEWQAILDEGEDEGRSQSGINNDTVLTRTLHAYAMERDIIGKDHSRYLGIPTVDIKAKKGALNDLQLAKLDELARAGFPGVSEAMVSRCIGLRISEFLSLTPFAYRSEDGGYLQYGMKSAAGRDRIIPIHPKIFAYVQQWLLVEKGMSSDRYRISVSAPVAEQSGIPEAIPHWCRHTFATFLSRAKVDKIKVKPLLGYSLKGNITATYIYPTPADLAKEAKRLA